MDLTDERARAQAAIHWRRQLQLTCLAAMAFVLTAGSTRLVLADFGRDPAHRAYVIAALAVSALGLLAVLALLLVHVFRVAAFTFRRGEPH
jgi:hypothetical protein